MGDQPLPAVFWEIHIGNLREGPGCRESTRRAFGMVEGLPAHPRILDIGCDPGAQTLDLAEISEGRLVAVDTHLPYRRYVENVPGTGRHKN